MSTGDKVVCVTGGSGYIAFRLVKLLLQRGYTVKATVRNPGVQLPFKYFAFADVRDVALVHTLALENPSASGRYCLVGETVHHHDILKMLCKLYPTLHLPGRYEDDGPLASAYRVSREKVEGLGTTFTPLEVSVRDNIESLMRKGFPLV